MTREKYLEKLKILQEKHQKEIFQLKKKFIFSNNSVQIGDIVLDNYCTIKVKNIKFTTTGDHPQCIYEGERLTRRGKPYKNGELGQVWQCNLSKVEKNKMKQGEF